MTDIYCNRCGGSVFGMQSTCRCGSPLISPNTRDSDELARLQAIESAAKAWLASMQESLNGESWLGVYLRSILAGRGPTDKTCVCGETSTRNCPVHGNKGPNQ